MEMERPGRNIPKVDEEAVACMDASLREIEENISRKISERDELKDITQRQLNNISELQKKCEETNIAINQLPGNKKVASERFDEAMSLIEAIQKKQIHVNEMLNIAMREFDETISMSCKSKEQIESELDLANQRKMIYQSNLTEIRNLIGLVNASFENELKKKSFYHQTVKNYIDGNSEQTLMLKLNSVSEKLSQVQISNKDVEKEISMVQVSLKNTDEKTSAYQDAMKEKISGAKRDKENAEARYEEGHKELLQILREITTTEVGNRQLQEKLNSLRCDLSQHQEKTMALTQEIKAIKLNVSNQRNELEILNEDCLKLQEGLKQVFDLEEQCSQIQEHINQLKKEKEELIFSKKHLEDDISKTTLSLENSKNTIEKNTSDLAEIKYNLNVSHGKIDQIKATSQVERETVNNKLTDTEDKIQKIKEIKFNIMDSIQVKKSKLEELKLMLTLNKEKNESLENELAQSKEENKLKKEGLLKTLDSLKTSRVELSERVGGKELELKEKQGQWETIQALLEKLNKQKVEKQELLDKFENEKKDLKHSFIETLEEKLGEQMKMKEEKQSALDRAKDNASKAEFSFYRFKRLVQRHKGEMNAMEETLKTFDCENEAAGMLLNWLVDSVNSAQSQTEDDEAREPNAESDGDMPVQRYISPGSQENKEKRFGETSDIDARSSQPSTSQSRNFKMPSQVKSYGESSQTQKHPRSIKHLTIPSERRAAPSGPSFWKKPRKKEEAERTILDRVADSQSDDYD